MDHYMAVPAKVDDILGEKASGPDWHGVVAMKTLRRVVHEGVRIRASIGHGRRHYDQEDQAPKTAPLNSS
jgi:hypothetical protein